MNAKTSGFDKEWGIYIVSKYLPKKYQLIMKCKTVTYSEETWQIIRVTKSSKLTLAVLGPCTENSASLPQHSSQKCVT